MLQQPMYPSNITSDQKKSQEAEGRPDTTAVREMGVLKRKSTDG